MDRSPPKTRYDLCAGHYQCRQIDVLVPFSVYSRSALRIDTSAGLEKFKIRFQKKNSLSGARTHKSITLEQYIFKAGIEKYFRLFFGANENSKKSFRN